jgi:signal transduction histidine kinase
MEAKQKLNILLVDDHLNNLLVLEAVLESLGQNLVKAQSGEEALECLLKQDFGLILLDVQMPGMDGFETASLIRRRERSRNTPIIFLTAIDKSSISTLKGYSLGCVDYMFKPIAPDVLRSKIAVFIDLFNKTEEVRRLSERVNELEQVEEERARLLVREQEARAEAEAANQAKDEFLAMVSHELRTPLTPLIGWIEMLSSQKLDQTTYSQAIDSIERSAKLQAQIVEDLLDISRIIMGKLHIEIREICPEELQLVVQTAVDALRPIAESKKIRLQEDFNRITNSILGDSDRLQQVVGNLVSNAIKFTPAGGSVEIKLELIGPHVEITVSDTGKGISPDFLPYVFERFRQADSKITRSHGGLGLGLAIARYIVELHGGTVFAHSRGEDKGATFIVKLPVIVAPDGAEKLRRGSNVGVESSEPNPNLDFLQILVVDDEPDTRLMIKTALERYGAAVIPAANAGEALEWLKKQPIDLLLSDIAMPEEDGYTLINKVRALKPEQGGNIPAVALTAYARAEDCANTLSAGFQMHMPKPFEPIELARAIARLVRKGEDNHKDTKTQRRV